MKNKHNKYNKIIHKKFFTKQEILTMNKYPHLLAYDIPYDVINRAYKRYIKSLNKYLSKNDYPRYWFKKDKREFSIAIKTYIESKQNNHIFKPYTRGWVAIEIAKLSKIDKYL